jgi:type I restriction enzyme R subunit
MPGRHTEKAFEDAVEEGLLEGGWKRGHAGQFDRETAIVPEEFLAFFQSSQPELAAALKAQHGTACEAGIVDSLAKTLASHGTLHVLRHGFKFYGKKIEGAWFRPSHGLNPDVVAKYAANRATVIRQVKFIPGHDDSLDVVLFVNGIPVATAELKNPLTGQDVHDAVAQYQRRDQRHVVFQFKKRALVHFAVDPNLVYMTTRLEGSETRFLPFNRGRDGGDGNPDHPSGFPAAYLWQEVWQRDSFLDILGRFVHLLAEERVVDGKKVEHESIIFPRFHQLEAVRNLETAARKDGAGHAYLIQHSAGSGKSNSIAWLAHRLAGLHDQRDKKVFDSVVVVTDRRVLDKQLQDTIYQFEHKQGVVAKIDQDSTQLAEALRSGTQVTITTLQKFPFITEKIGKLPNRTYALVVDEAHSSQSGEAARQMKEVLAAQSLETAEAEDATEEDDVLDRLAEVMASRGRQKNISFFAFTATPKAKTLEVFGHRDAEGKPIPFHLYSMRQAIEEGFILDVLANYISYKAYYGLVKAASEDPRVPKKQALAQLARFMSLHPHNVAQKTEVIVEHFRANVRHRIGGRAKAMVVTSSRLHAVRYKLAFDRYIKERGYSDVKALVAFSGTVKDPDTDYEYTEPGMNVTRDGKQIRERQLPDAFAGSEYQVLLVANKYQTGFDQPLLHTMYVDKRLSGVQAVQTLSRLNRIHPGKEDTFVLDFVNDPEEIRRSFQPYFQRTEVEEAADPQTLYELQQRLEQAQVFWHSEVEAFAKAFYGPDTKKAGGVLAELNRQIRPGLDRFVGLEEDKQDEFRNALRGYVRLYSFVSQIMPFQDPDLEKLFTFCRFLERALPHDPKKAPLNLDGDVALRYYRLQKLSEQSLSLTAKDALPLRPPKDVGTRQATDEQVVLSAIIEVLNERFGTEFTKADELLFDQFVEAAKKDEEVVQRAHANPLENFSLSMKAKLEGLMIDRMDQNEEIVTRYLNDPDFQRVAFELLVKKIYEDIRARPSLPYPRVT